MSATIRPLNAFGYRSLSGRHHAEVTLAQLSQDVQVDNEGTTTACNTHDTVAERITIGRG